MNALLRLFTINNHLWLVFLGIGYNAGKLLRIHFRQKVFIRTF